MNWCCRENEPAALQPLITVEDYLTFYISKDISMLGMLFANETNTS